MRDARMVSVLAVSAILLPGVSRGYSQTPIPAQVSWQTTECLECHATETAGIYRERGTSKHYRANVRCYECHQVNEDGSLKPTGWPNTGMGRLNPDGSIGACSACHQLEPDRPGHRRNSGRGMRSNLD
jgi:hypothetical protein